MIGVIRWYLTQELHFWTLLSWRLCPRSRKVLTDTRSPRMYAEFWIFQESTLYPVLRRLQKDDCLEVYDQAYAGRNRRYYKLTEKGQAQLNLYKIEWKNYSTKIGSMFEDVGRNADSGHMREEN